MITQKYGKVIKGLGGLFEVRIENEENKKPEYLTCRAKGNLKRDEEKVLIGDNVCVSIDDSLPDGIVISEVFERKNSLIRPPLANLDLLFIVFAAAKPEPVLETIDKLISIAEHNSITPVAVIAKSDVSEGGKAENLAAVYKSVGIDVFITSSNGKIGIDELSEYIKKNVTGGRCAAFAGASGVGKSTLMNTLFPGMSLATSEISRKIERGKHTTRHVEIFDIEGERGIGFLADTPGFSLIDFARFDFFELADLPETFREFSPYIGACRYSDCAHVGEGADECAIAKAVRDGKIAESRLLSYRSLYTVLKNKNQYK